MQNSNITYLKYPINDFQKDNNLIKFYNEYNEKDFTNLKVISIWNYENIYIVLIV